MSFFGIIMYISLVDVSIWT